MSSINSVYKPGDTIARVTKVANADAVRIYNIMCNSSASGSLELPPPNVHNDEDYARGQGLREPIVDGVLMTSWVESELRGLFGIDYLKTGWITSKYVAPLYVGDELVVDITVDEFDAKTGKITLTTRYGDGSGRLTAIGQAGCTISDQESVT
jgi:hypothetical protein